MINEADTYCGKCIKADVCGMEGVYDPSMTFCAYRVEARPKGEWKKVGTSVMCSICEHGWGKGHAPKDLKDYIFCPNCGAAMETKEMEPKNPCPCDTCGCMIDRTGCQMDLCSDYKKWKEGDENDK